MFSKAHTKSPPWLCGETSPWFYWLKFSNRSQKKEKSPSLVLVLPKCWSHWENGCHRMGAESFPCHSCVKFGVDVLLNRVTGNINVCDKPLHMALASLGLSHFPFQPMAGPSFQVPQDLGIDFPLSCYCWVPKGFTDLGQQSKLSTALVLPDLENKSVENLICSAFIHIPSTSPETHLMPQ